MFWFELLVAPVALVAWGLLLVALLLWRSDSRAAFRLCLGVLVFYVAAATPLGANALAGALEARAQRDACPPDRAPAAIVILAGGVRGDPDHATEVDRLRLATLRRTLAGARLARAHPAWRVIVSGGEGGRNSEADLMANLLVQLGIGSGRITRDSRSRNTWQSAVAVTRLARTVGVARLVLVTSAMHMPRAAAVFRAQGLALCRYPVDYRHVSPDLPGALVPQISALVKTHRALHEIVGCLWYWLRGRFTPPQPDRRP
ncbi:MAG TPA: YdcF family protein [Gammaproteobacteria bacterium]|nr:YdcF family protein [Gammaproteobacteria bacterium]